MTTKQLTKEDIRAASDLGMEKLAVPEWGGFVYVRTVTAKEKDAFERAMLAKGGETMENVRAQMAVLTVCDENRTPLFTDADAEWLAGKSAAPLSRVLNVALRLNAFRESDVKELAEGFENRQGANSSTA